MLTVAASRSSFTLVTTSFNVYMKASDPELNWEAPFPCCLARNVGCRLRHELLYSHAALVSSLGLHVISGTMGRWRLLHTCCHDSQRLPHLLRVETWWVHWELITGFVLVSLEKHKKQRRALFSLVEETESVVSFTDGYSVHRSSSLIVPLSVSDHIISPQLMLSQH